MRGLGGNPLKYPNEGNFTDRITSLWLVPNISLLKHAAEDSADGVDTIGFSKYAKGQI